MNITFNKRCTILSFFLLGISVMYSQAPSFTKYEVLETGAGVYFPEEPVFDLTYSEDSSEVMTTEVESGDISYGTIVVKFKDNLGEDKEDWEAVLMSYLTFLNDNAFNLESVADPGYGHTLPSHPAARGILEYGEDEDGFQFAIKGWVDKKMLAVMYVYYEGEMNVNVQSLFLDGFRFPEE